jgi:hypothetical protein
MKNKPLGNKTALFWHLQQFDMCFVIQFKIKWRLNYFEVLVKSTLEE